MVRPGRSPPATEDRPSQHGSRSPERVIERAASATGDVEAAARFVEDGGLASLRAAVERADPATARRGRRAIAAFEWIRWAGHAEQPEPDRRSSGNGSERRRQTNQGTRWDPVRSARGTR